MGEMKGKAETPKWKAVLLASSLSWAAFGLLIMVASSGFVSAANLPPLALFLAIALHIWAVMRNGVLGPEALTVVAWIALAALVIFALR